VLAAQKGTWKGLVYILGWLAGNSIYLLLSYT